MRGRRTIRAASLAATGVAYPDGLADHLAHGDTIGICGNGM